MLKTLKASRAPPAMHGPCCPRPALQSSSCRCWYLPVPTPWGGGASVSKGSVLLPFAAATVGTFVIPFRQLKKQQSAECCICYGPC